MGLCSSQDADDDEQAALDDALAKVAPSETEEHTPRTPAVTIIEEPEIIPEGPLKLEKPKTPEPESPTYDPYEYQKDDMVRLINLPQRRELEGFVGRITGPFKVKKGRWPIKLLGDKKTINVKPESLEKATHPGDPNHRRVVSKKLGPIEIGNHASYDAAHYNMVDDDEDFLKPRFKKIDYSKNVKGKNKTVAEIGTNNDYVAANFEYKNDDDFLQERVRPAKPIKNDIFGSKETVAEIGIAKDYVPPNYDLKEDNEDFLAPRNGNKKHGYE